MVIRRALHWNKTSQLTHFTLANFVTLPKGVSNCIVVLNHLVKRWDTFNTQSYAEPCSEIYLITGATTPPVPGEPLKFKRDHIKKRDNPKIYNKKKQAGTFFLL